MPFGLDAHQARRIRETQPLIRFASNNPIVCSTCRDGAPTITSGYTIQVIHPRSGEICAPAYFCAQCAAEIEHNRKSIQREVDKEIRVCRCGTEFWANPHSTVVSCEDCLDFRRREKKKILTFAF